ncbi:hypothetical protein Phou_005670 [Phytohabitans houttuyneae]|uniref:Uncharacterized protein n=1 Tax=Phytohabitans houttuyneae TaxID=1076126 RepID=A0A6V8K3L5_9ACTN|nr:hypothetical protein Phou_005670 [Phytohabitans houttuyneae]
MGADGTEIVRFTARTEINRDEYNVIQGVASAVISKKVDVLITAEARKQD